MPDSDLQGLSPRLLARIVGILSLAGIATGAFDIGYVQMHLVVAGDSSATLHNILAHQTLFRLGFSAHLFELILNVPAEILTFLLLRRVNGIIAAFALYCGVLGIAIEAVELLSAWVPLQLAIEASLRTSFNPEQVRVVTSLTLQLQQAALLLSWLFYGLDEMALGILMFRSKFLPRAVGILLGTAGLCYFTDGFTTFLAPHLNARINPYIIYPCFPGEFLSSLWLATMGLNVAKWKALPTRPLLQE